MTARFGCFECSVQCNDEDDAEAHEERTGHEMYENPPQNATDRERQARGFDPNPEPTEGHLSVVDGKRVGRRRSDY